MIKISNPSKMKITGKRVGCWSLEARVSCPGSKDEEGNIVEVCKSCYATKGMYRFPVVKAARQTNRDDYHKDDWVDRMVKQVSKYDYFRFFDSGDCETHELACKIKQVVDKCPNTLFWIPTRSDKIERIGSVLLPHKFSDGTYSHALGARANAVVRPSADNIGLNNKERSGVNSYVIEPKDIFEAKKQGIHVCPVGINANQKTCDTCTMCYTDAKVAYVVH